MLVYLPQFNQHVLVFRASRPQAGTIFLTKMYGPHSFTPRYGLRHGDSSSSDGSVDEDELWTDSPWPPRNAPCFDLLNAFMERYIHILISEKDFYSNPENAVTFSVKLSNVKTSDIKSNVGYNNLKI